MLSWADSSPNTKGHLDWFSHFCTNHWSVSLQWAAPSPFKIASSHGRCGAPSNTWFPGATWVLRPNGISIDSAVFAGLTTVTDKPTDHTTWSVTIGRIYRHSTAMQPKNTKPKPKSQQSTVRTAHMCVHNCHTHTQNRPILIIFPLILQIIITAQIKSTCERGPWCKGWQCIYLYGWVPFLVPSRGISH